jgi:TRAP-type C4-dicarboxylate transport system substrate-binding protein
VNTAWFERLSPEKQEMLSRTTRLAVVYQRQLLMALIEEQTTFLQEAGATTIELIEWEKLHEAIGPLYLRFITESVPELADTLQAIERVK